MCLIQFYTITKEELSHIKPLYKFVTFKSIVFLTWWQGVAIALLYSLHLFRGPVAQALQFKSSIQDFIICIEMGIASMVHLYVFPAKPYKLMAECFSGAVSVLGYYVSAECRIDPDEVRDSERPTKLRLPQPDIDDARSGMNIKESVRDVVIGGGEYKSGACVIYLGAASGTTVSHVSDLVGPTGVVYAVEFSHRSGRDLVNMAKKRTNVIPIIEDARHPAKYRMLVGMVDVIFSDVAQPDQARILALNASYFLKTEGHFVISIKANCIDSTVPAEAVFAQEVKKLQAEQFKPSEQVTLEPFERDHACVVGSYRVPKKQKAAA